LKLVHHFGVVEKVRLPRAGRRRFGVPVGGAFDVNSLRLANAATGNIDDTLAFELSMASADFVVEQSGWVAAVGAAAKVIVAGREGESNSIWPVHAGDRITAHTPSQGCRIYLQWGPAGRVGRLDKFSHSSEILVTPGPDFSWHAWSLPHTAQISLTLNRVGVRSEPIAALSHQLDVTSRPHLTGSVQVTPAGELIFIGPDGPVTGGYPQPWVVARTCLPMLGQATPGTEIRIKIISPEEARDRWRVDESRLSKRLRELRLGASGYGQ